VKKQLVGQQTIQFKKKRNATAAKAGAI